MVPAFQRKLVLPCIHKHSMECKDKHIMQRKDKHIPITRHKYQKNNGLL
jgi:hypothetical protein